MDKQYSVHAISAIVYLQSESTGNLDMDTSGYHLFINVLVLSDVTQLTKTCCPVVDNLSLSWLSPNSGVPLCTSERSLLLWTTFTYMTDQQHVINFIRQNGRQFTSVCTAWHLSISLTFASQ